jgi:hypothetical protein
MYIYMYKIYKYIYIYILYLRNMAHVCTCLARASLSELFFRASL